MIHMHTCIDMCTQTLIGVVLVSKVRGRQAAGQARRGERPPLRIIVLRPDGVDPEPVQPAAGRPAYVINGPHLQLLGPVAVAVVERHPLARVKRGCGKGSRGQEPGRETGQGAARFEDA